MSVVFLTQIRVNRYYLRNEAVDADINTVCPIL